MAVSSENRAQLRLSPAGLRRTGGPPGFGGGAGATDFYFNGPAQPLRQHGGILFPFQPDMTYQASANYSPYDMTHTNYTFQAYRNSPSPTIQLNTTFASTTEDEARYTMGVLHFLRSVTKMFFGINETGSPGAGTPPPVLRFSAFGETQFNNIPVLVQDFSTTYDSNVDLKDIDGSQIPVVMNIFIGLLIQVSPAKQKNDFSLRRFASGELYKGGFV